MFNLLIIINNSYLFLNIAHKFSDKCIINSSKNVIDFLLKTKRSLTLNTLCEHSGDRQSFLAKVKQEEDLDIDQTPKVVDNILNFL